MTTPDSEFNSILRLLDDENPTVRQAVQRKLADYGPDLGPALEQADPDVRSLAIELQREYEREQFVELWRDWLKQPSDLNKLETGQGLLASYLSHGATDGGAISGKLDRLAAEFGRQFETRNFRNLAAFLFASGLFQGDAKGYYHPDNSNFGRVLSQRHGNPISLACLFILVGARAGFDVGGCNYPAHFLARARCERDGGLYLIDCFNEGRIIPSEELIRHHPLSSRGVRDVVINPATPEAIIARALRNLDNAFGHTNQISEQGFVRRLWQLMAKSGEPG